MPDIFEQQEVISPERSLTDYTPPALFSPTPQKANTDRGEHSILNPKEQKPDRLLTDYDPFTDTPERAVDPKQAAEAEANFEQFKGSKDPYALAYLNKELKKTKYQGRDDWWQALKSAAPDSWKGSEPVDPVLHDSAIHLQFAERVGNLLDKLDAEGNEDLKANFLAEFPSDIQSLLRSETLDSPSMQLTSELDESFRVGLDTGGTYTRSGVSDVISPLAKGDYYDVKDLLKLDVDPSLYIAAQMLHARDWQEKHGGISKGSFAGFITGLGVELTADVLVTKGAGKFAQGSKLVQRSKALQVLNKSPWTRRLMNASGVAATSVTTKSIGSFFNDEYSIQDVPKHTAFEVAGYLALSTVGGRLAKYAKGKRGAGGELNKLFKSVTDKVRRGDLESLTIDEIADFIHVSEKLRAEDLSGNLSLQNFVNSSKGTYNTLKGLLELQPITKAPLLMSKPKVKAVTDNISERVSEILATSKGHKVVEDIVNPVTLKPIIKAGEPLTEANVTKLVKQGVEAIPLEGGTLNHFELFGPYSNTSGFKLSGIFEDITFKSLSEAEGIAQDVYKFSQEGFKDLSLDYTGAFPRVVAREGSDVILDLSPLIKEADVPAVSQRLLNAKKIIKDADQLVAAKETAKIVSELMEDVPGESVEKTTEDALAIVETLKTKKGDFSPMFWKKVAKTVVGDLEGKPETITALRLSIAEPLGEMHDELLDLMAMGFDEESARAADVVSQKFKRLMPLLEMYMDITGKSSHILRSFQISAVEEATKRPKSIFDLSPKELGKMLDGFNVQKVIGEATEVKPEVAYKQQLKKMMDILNDYQKIFKDPATDPIDRISAVLGTMKRTGILSMFASRRMFEFPATVVRDAQKWITDFAGSVMGRFHPNANVRWASKQQFSRLFAFKKTLGTFLDAMGNKEVLKAQLEGLKSEGLSGYFKAYGDNVNVLTQGSVEGSFTKNRLAFDELFKPKEQQAFLKNLAELTGKDVDELNLKGVQVIWDNITDLAQLLSKNAPMLVDGIQDNLYLQPAIMESVEKLTFNLLETNGLTQTQADVFMAKATELFKLQLKGKATDDAALKLYKEVVDMIDVNGPMEMPILQRKFNSALEDVKHILAERTWKSSLTNPKYRSRPVQVLGKLTQGGSTDTGNFMIAEFLNPFVRSSVNFLSWGVKALVPFRTFSAMVGKKADPLDVVQAFAGDLVSATTLGSYIYMRKNGIIRVADPTEEGREARGGLTPVTLEFDENSYDISGVYPNVQAALKVMGAFEPYFEFHEKKSRGETTTKEEEEWAIRAVNISTKLGLVMAEPFLRTPSFKYSQLQNLEPEDYYKVLSVELQSFGNSFLNYPIAWLMGGYEEQKFKQYLTPEDYIRPKAAAGTEFLPSFEVGGLEGPIRPKEQIPLYDAGGFPIKDGWSDQPWLNLLQERMIGKNIRHRQEPYLKVSRELGADLFGKPFKKLRTPSGGKLEVPRKFYEEFNKNLRAMGYDTAMNALLNARPRFSNEGFKDFMEKQSRSLRAAAVQATIAQIGMYDESYTEAEMEALRSLYKGLDIDE